MWSEAPVLGNHWLLAGLVDLALLFAVAVGAVRRRWSDATDLAERFLPVARWCLLGFYFFASFAKLNSAFFDRSVSCATFYFDQSTDSLGLSALQLDGAAGLQRTVIVATAAIELSIPWLLVFRRTRNLGVVVAVAFHTVLALDRTHQFFDFSSVLAALFVLFLPPAFGVWVAERVGFGPGAVAAARRASSDVRAPGARGDARARGHGGRLRRADARGRPCGWGGCPGRCAPCCSSPPRSASSGSAHQRRDRRALRVGPRGASCSCRCWCS